MKRVKFDIDPDNEALGVKTMSLVDSPAMESDFIAMSKENPAYVELKVTGYKQVVAGLALIPDRDFLRRNSEGETYAAYFTKEAIERIRNKFHKELMTSSVNVDHSQKDYIDAYLIESYIIDSPERLADLKAKGIKDPIIGAWFVAYKIEAAEVFKRVLAGELTGFSVEIFVQQSFSKQPDQSELKEAIARLEKKIDDLTVKPKGKSKGIFERRLRMINSEINN